VKANYSDFPNDVIDVPFDQSVAELSFNYKKMSIHISPKN